MAEVDKRIKTYPAKFLVCRRFGHASRETDRVLHTEDGVRYVVVVNNCANNCGYIRDDYYSREGDYQFSRPHYPKGYLIEPSDRERAEGIQFRGRAITGALIRQTPLNSLKRRQ